MKEEGEIELSIVMPCLNEAETVGRCIEKARHALRNMNCVGEIIVADNGSTDGSPEVAQSSGARVIRVPIIGYGSALLGGIQAARGRYIIMGDADDSYDFEDLAQFLERLRAGCDLVMGNRFTGGIQPGAMPGLHRYLGNPVLSSLGRLLFRSPCRDFHCGLRGFSKAAALRMDLRTTGMEFASEMVVKATLSRMRIAEVPITLSTAGRSRSPHLRSWRGCDGLAGSAGPLPLASQLGIRAFASLHRSTRAERVTKTGRNQAFVSALPSSSDPRDR